MWIKGAALVVASLGLTVASLTTLMSGLVQYLETRRTRDLATRHDPAERDADRG